MEIFIIPKGIKRIEKEGFKERADIVSVVIPGSVTYMEGNAVSGCPNLESIFVPKGSEERFKAMLRY